MTITQLHCSRLVSFGSYENVTFAATATVDKDESVFVAAADLKAFVDREAVAFKEERNAWQKAQQELDEVRWQVETKRSEASELEEKCKKMTEFLKNHGVDVSSEVPF